MQDKRIVVLWWHTVGTDQSNTQILFQLYIHGVAKYYKTLLDYYSISLLPLCSQRPLLIVNIPPLSSLISTISYFFLRLHLSFHFSSISLPSCFWYFFTHLNLVILHLPPLSIYPLLLLIFPQTSIRKALHISCWDTEGVRETVSSVRQREMMRESGVVSGWHNVTVTGSQPGSGLKTQQHVNLRVTVSFTSYHSVRPLPSPQ